MTTEAQLRPSRPLRLVTGHPVERGDIVSLFGLDVSRLTTSELARQLINAASDYARLTVSLATISTFSGVQLDRNRRELAAGLDILACASLPVALASRARGHRVGLVQPSKLLDTVLEEADARHQRHLFYGSFVVAGKADEEAPVFESKWPVLAAFARDLDWSNVQDLADRINEAEADFVWVCLPSPQRERWLATFRPLLNAPVLVGLTDHLPRVALRNF